jgi:hypothetical protein
MSRQSDNDRRRLADGHRRLGVWLDPTDQRVLVAVQSFLGKRSAQGSIRSALFAYAAEHGLIDELPQAILVRGIEQQMKENG